MSHKIDLSTHFHNDTSDKSIQKKPTLVQSGEKGLPPQSNSLAKQRLLQITKNYHLYGSIEWSSSKQLQRALLERRCIPSPGIVALESGPSVGHHSSDA